MSCTKKILKEFPSSLHPASRKQMKSKGIKKKNMNLSRCEFREIPSPSKFTQSPLLYSLYGDVIVSEKSGMLYSDISFLTKFKEFRNIEVAKSQNAQLIQVTVEDKTDIRQAPWKFMVQILESSECKNFRSWASMIKNYCTNYEKFIKDLEEKENTTIKIEETANDYKKIDKETENRRCHLLASFPCIYLKTQYEKGSGIQTREICFNSQLIQELGYSQESFITTVFQEGIPQLLSQNVEAASEILKILMTNFFSLPREGLETPEYKHLLFMKSNYSKSVLVQTHFLRNYQNRNFGIDTIMVIKPISEAVLNYKIIPKKIPKVEFLQQKINQEQTQAEFLSIYYNMSFDRRFTYNDKICRIKELPLLEQEFYYHEKDGAV